VFFFFFFGDLDVCYFSVLQSVRSAVDARKKEVSSSSSQKRASFMALAGAFTKKVQEVQRREAIRAEVYQLNTKIDQATARFNVSKYFYAEQTPHVRPDSVKVESSMRVENVLKGIVDIVADTHRSQEQQGTKLIEIEELQKQAKLDADIGMPTTHATHDLYLCTPSALVEKLGPVHDACWHALNITGCLEGTRKGVFKTLRSWAANTPTELPSAFRSVIWVNGLAGTGKSTVARSFCEEMEGEGRLCASFFITRHVAERRNPTKIVHTIAYQIAVRNSEFRQVVCDAMRETPDIASRPIIEQVSRLIGAPLVRMGAAASSVVIVLDALDECRRDSRGREGGDLLLLLARAIQTAPCARLFVTSRNEQNLRTMFGEIETNHSCLHTVQLHDIERTEVQDDMICRLFTESFKIVAKRLFLPIDEEWPDAKTFQLLLHRAGVLFICAATIVRFIDDVRHDPRKRMKILLGDADSASSSPYALLDQLYVQVLDDAVDQEMDTGHELCVRLRSILGAVITLRDQLKEGALIKLLDLNAYETSYMLQRLASLLLITPNYPIRIFHPSLADFLLDPARCQDSRFLMCSEDQHGRIAQRCLALMNAHLKRDICAIEDPTLLNAEVPDLEELVGRYIPEELHYACAHWVEHLSRATPSERLLQELENFCISRLLHWVEALSLIGKLSQALSNLPVARIWCQVSLARAS
jgi:hypothetical protein